MRELQGLVLKRWVEAGGDRKESLMMEYVEVGGRSVKVTKSTKVDALRAAISLNLMPKAKPKPGGALHLAAVDEEQEGEEAEATLASRSYCD